MKKIKWIIPVFLAIIIVVFFFAHNNKEQEGIEVNKTEYEKISAERAKEIMDKEKDYVILDVRTAEEYNEGHINGAVLIDHEEIRQKAQTVIPDKNKMILVYCRSGRRSKIAAAHLCELGYKNVLEFGGIIDWTYEVTKN